LGISAAKPLGKKLTGLVAERFVLAAKTVKPGGSCCLPIGKPLSMTRVSAILEAKLLSEQLPGAKANGRSFGLYPLLDVGDLMFEISRPVSCTGVF